MRVYNLIYEVEFKGGKIFLNKSLWGVYVFNNDSVRGRKGIYLNFKNVEIMYGL